MPTPFSLVTDLSRTLRLNLSNREAEKLLSRLGDDAEGGCARLAGMGRGAVLRELEEAGVIEPRSRPSIKDE